MGKKTSKLKRAARLMAIYTNKQLHLLITLTWAFLILYVAYNEIWRFMHP